MDIDVALEDEINTARREIDATLNLLIELFLADVDHENEDVACLLMRVRELHQRIQADGATT